MTKEIKEMSDETVRESLAYYKDEKTIVHLVLKNRRFYNGRILELRETILILEDNKIGKIPIPFRDVFLIESFHGPDGGGKGEDE